MALCPMIPVRIGSWIVYLYSGRGSKEHREKSAGERVFSWEKSKKQQQVYDLKKMKDIAVGGNLFH